MTGDPVYTIVWTAVARKLWQEIPDQRVRRLIAERVAQLATAPDQQGKPLLGELAGFRSVRAVGQRYRIIYRVARREITVIIAALGRRHQGDRRDIYELARKLIAQGLAR
jgi:mRNA interferase RelE/StbE